MPSTLAALCLARPPKSRAPASSHQSPQTPPSFTPHAPPMLLQEAAQPAVAHALAVRAALAAQGYRRFFSLYASAPALGRALMDIYVPKLRFDALGVVVKAFKPSVPLPFLAHMLGFAAAGVAGAAGSGEGSAEPASPPLTTSSSAETGKPDAGAPPSKPDSPAAAAAAAAVTAANGSTEAGPAAGPGAGTSSNAPGAAAAGGSEDEAVPLPGCQELRYDGDHPAKVGLTRRGPETNVRLGPACSLHPKPALVACCALLCAPYLPICLQTPGC